MKSNDTPTEAAWALALKNENVERYHSGPAASPQVTLYAFTVETLIQRQITEASTHRFYRSRLIRDSTNAILWDYGKFANKSANEDHLDEAINTQYEIEHASKSQITPG